jgi:uncharacterized protein YbjT (DUF2867 family)
VDGSIGRRVLVTGGTGVLGRALVPVLEGTGVAVRVAGRRAPERASTGGWVPLHLQSGEGVDDAVRGADTVVHLASSPYGRTEQVDRIGTERLAAAARAAGVGHFLYVSIVGVDRIPFGYYRHKLAAEQAVERSGVPWTILRSTQFHPFLDGMVGQAARLPVVLLPADFRFQPVDPGEVAVRLAELLAAGPAGRAPDVGGPEVRTLRELASDWLGARGMRRPVLRLPLPGATAVAFRGGEATAPERRYGRVTWTEWLHRTYATAAGASVAG